VHSVSDDDAPPRNGRPPASVHLRFTRGCTQGQAPVLLSGSWCLVLCITLNITSHSYRTTEEIRDNLRLSSESQRRPASQPPLTESQRRPPWPTAENGSNFGLFSSRVDRIDQRIWAILLSQTPLSSYQSRESVGQVLNGFVSFRIARNVSNDAWGVSQSRDHPKIP